MDYGRAWSSAADGVPICVESQPDVALADHPIALRLGVLADDGISPLGKVAGEEIGLLPPAGIGQQLRHPHWLSARDSGFLGNRQQGFLRFNYLYTGVDRVYRGRSSGPGKWKTPQPNAPQSSPAMPAAPAVAARRMRRCKIDDAHRANAVPDTAPFPETGFSSMNS
jgi:hypothetical protein